jgi:threonine synthase
MDILVSSNLERQLFELTGRNGKAISEWMNNLNTNKSFTVDAETLEKLQQTFKAAHINNGECLTTIANVFSEYNYLIDPHTAVAYATAKQLQDENPVLIASTAHWAKFGNNVYRALHNMQPEDALPADVEALTGCQLNKLIAKEANQTYIPAKLANLDEMEVRFTQVINEGQDSIEEAVLTFLS